VKYHDEIILTFLVKVLGHAMGVCCDGTVQCDCHISNEYSNISYVILLSGLVIKPFSMQW